MQMTPLDEARPVVITDQETAGLLYSGWADDKLSQHRAKPFSTFKEIGNGFFMCGGVEN